MREGEARSRTAFDALHTADCDANKQIAAAYGVKGFPTIVSVLDGRLLETYQGERDAASIASWAVKQLSKEVSKRLGGKAGSSSSGGGDKPRDSEPGGGKHVAHLTAAAFDKAVLKDDSPWLIEFYAPWCGHCKALAPEWARAAEDLQKRVKLGAVDCTKEESLCAKHSVKGYPTIMVFGRDKAHPTPYEGARKAPEITAFGMQLAEREGKPLEIAQLLGAASYTEACTAAGRQACVLAFLPHILDAGAAARNKTLASLAKVSGAFLSRPWGWAWLEAGAQPLLEQAVGVAGFPALAMVNAKKGVAALMRSSLSEANAKDFLNSLAGAQPVSLPAAEQLQATAAWDGKDAEAPVEEDEFDLNELNEL